MHPIIISLIDKKWNYFASRILTRRFFFAFLYLFIFLLTTIFEQVPSRSELEGKQSILQRTICTIGHLIVLFGALWKAGSECIEMNSIGIRNYLGASGSVFLENCLACSFCFSILIARLLRVLDVEMETIVLAFASLLGWAYMLFFTMPFRFTGPFVIMIYKMLFNDVLRFCIIYLIFLLGFSQSFFILFRNDGEFLRSILLRNAFSLCFFRRFRIYVQHKALLFRFTR